jgi:hypothetical protein
MNKTNQINQRNETNESNQSVLAFYAPRFVAPVDCFSILLSFDVLGGG